MAMRVSRDYYSKWFQQLISKYELRDMKNAQPIHEFDYECIHGSIKKSKA